jgi:hypothetical protein
MLVKADAVVAEPIHLLPGLEMLGIGANRDVGLEITVRERVGQLAADLEMVELFAVGEQIKDEDLHGALPGEFLGPPWRRIFIGRLGLKARPAKRFIGSCRGVGAALPNPTKVGPDPALTGWC